jgi:hypothetical protein
MHVTIGVDVTVEGDRLCFLYLFTVMHPVCTCHFVGLDEAAHPFQFFFICPIDNLSLNV